MKNIDAIRQKPLEELARFLVRIDHEEEMDYDWDEEPFCWGLREVYITSDNTTFMEEKDAVRHEIAWLKAEEGEMEAWDE